MLDQRLLSDQAAPCDPPALCLGWPDFSVMWVANGERSRDPSWFADPAAAAV